MAIKTVRITELRANVYLGSGIEEPYRRPSFSLHLVHSFGAANGYKRYISGGKGYRLNGKSRHASLLSWEGKGSVACMLGRRLNSL